MLFNQDCLPDAIQLRNNGLNTLIYIMEKVYIDTTSLEGNLAISITHLCT